MASLRTLLFLLAPLLIVACKHPLKIEGQGDIIELENGLRGCSLDEFNAELTRCTGNEVFDTERAIYRALPRPGWRFSRWQGYCDGDSPGTDCQLNYLKEFAEFWDTEFPDTPVPALTAVFEEDKQAADGASYIASSFGATDVFARNPQGYGALLDALVMEDNSYRYTTLQASTRDYFNREPSLYSRQRDGLLKTGPDSTSLVSGGAATANLDLMTLVDTDSSDEEISVAYLMPRQEEASVSQLQGTYYCGHISTRALGVSIFFRAVLGGNGRGAIDVISDRSSRTGTTGVVYQVFEDGTTTFDYNGERLAGSLSADGSVFVGAEINSNAKGSAICIRSSSNQTLGSVQGSYYGAWMSAQPVSGVTDLLVDPSGQTAESVLRDSAGGREYFLQQDFMLVNSDGRLETSSNYGAVSADGRTLFIVDTNPNKFPTLIVYIKKT